MCSRGDAQLGFSLGVIIAFGQIKRQMITKMHISRGEARTPTTNGHEPQLAQGANGRREEHELIACFACDLLSFFVRLPILQTETGVVRDRSTIDRPRARLFLFLITRKARYSCHWARKPAHQLDRK
jgi:hypothetical protein